MNEFPGQRVIMFWSDVVAALTRTGYAQWMAINGEHVSVNDLTEMARWLAGEIVRRENAEQGAHKMAEILAKCECELFDAKASRSREETNTLKALQENDELRAAILKIAKVNTYRPGAVPGAIAEAVKLIEEKESKE